MNEERKKANKWALILIAICITSITGALSFFDHRASNKLLNALLLAKPGLHISELTQKLGKPMRDSSEVDELTLWGRIEDRSFRKDKKIFWYYVSTPPCRVLEVYTNQDGIIVYATWNSL